MQEMMPKVAAIRKEIDRRSLNVMLQVDGGINGETAAVAAKPAPTSRSWAARFSIPDPYALVKKIQDIT